MSKNIADRIPAERGAGGLQDLGPPVSDGSRLRSQRRFLPPYGKPLRESNGEFNGTDGVRTYIRIVPLSLRQALLVRPQRLPRSLGPDD